jgi:hypothetical protein
MRHALIVLDTTGSRVVLIAGSRGLSLPSVQVAREHPGAIDAVLGATRRRYGLRASVLRPVARPRDSATGAFNVALELELFDERPLRGRGARWIPVAEVESRIFSRKDDLEAWTRWRRPARVRPEWARPGWRDRALGWAARRIGARVTRVEQVRAWESSCVYRLRSPAGVFYLKAVAARCDWEPRLTRWLARRFPRLIAPVVAVGGAGRWLLTREVKGSILRHSRRLPAWERAAFEYGRLQRALVGRTPTLLRLGCPRRGPRWALRVMTGLLRDRRTLAAGGRERLSSSEIARLRALAPVLRSRGRALAAHAVPLTLDHADFWAGNMIAGRRGPVYLDWEDSTVSLPYWSVFMLPWSHGFHDRWGARGAAARRIKEAYLAGWSGRDGPGRYREAFDLAQTLAPLHYAATWARDTIPYLETSLETATLLPFFLRRVLETAPR